MAGTVGKGKSVHELHETGGTLCGAEYGARTRNGKSSSYITETNQEVTCKSCIKHTTKTETETVAPVSYGPNARENFTAMMISAVTEAAKDFWSRKIAALPA